MKAKSIKIWTISFLSFDLLFWLYVGYSCIADPISCSEIAMFGGYFYYLPFTLLPLTIPIPIWSIIHGLIGALIGWLLRNHVVRWWIAVIISGALLFGTSFVLSQWQLHKELDRETITQVWVVNDASSSQLQFSTAKKLSDGKLDIEEGEITLYLESYDTSHTKVDLLTCDQPNCTDDITISYKEYLEAKTTCHKNKATCPYKDLGTFPTVFEVTSNPKEIITMRQIILP